MSVAAAAFLLPTSGSAGASTVKGSAYELYYTDTGATPAAKYLPAISDAINARGGINGHPLKIVDCDDKGDSNQATQCAQQATSNPHVLGIAGNTSTCGSQLLQTLAGAHMASIGDQYFCAEDFKSPQVFPFSAGSLDPAAGAALGVTDLHTKNMAIATIDVPAGREYPPLVQSVVTPVGGHITGAVYIPFSAADMSPYASQVVTDGGFLVDGDTTAVGIRLGKALLEQGFKEPVEYNGTTWDAHTIKTNFGNPKNVYIESPYLESSAGYKMFVADMNKYAPGADYYSTDLSSVWLAAMIVQRWSKNVAHPTAPALLKYLSTAASINTWGMTIPLTYTKPAHVLNGLASRAVNPCTALYHYKSGKLVEVGKSIDMLNTAANRVQCAG
jgi:hypothetical protein